MKIKKLKHKITFISLYSIPSPFLINFNILLLLSLKSFSAHLLHYTNTIISRLNYQMTQLQKLDKNNTDYGTFLVQIFSFSSTQLSLIIFMSHTYYHIVGNFCCPKVSLSIRAGLTRYFC